MLELERVVMKDVIRNIDKCLQHILALIMQNGFVIGPPWVGKDIIATSFGWEIGPWLKG